MNVTGPPAVFARVERRIHLDVCGVAAMAAAYGSISAVSFVVEADLLTKQGVPLGGYEDSSTGTSPRSIAIVSGSPGSRLSNRRSPRFSAVPTLGCPPRYCSIRGSGISSWRGWQSRTQRQRLVDGSPVIADLIARQKLTVVAAVHDIATGARVLV